MSPFFCIGKWKIAEAVKKIKKRSTLLEERVYIPGNVRKYIHNSLQREHI